MPPPHEKLLAYRKALDAVAALRFVVAGIPADRGDLRDQLNRAAASVLLNLAEGASEYRPAEKARFYRMSRRSAAEYLATIDLLEALVGQSEPTKRCRPKLDETMALVTTLIVAMERAGW